MVVVQNVKYIRLLLLTKGAVFILHVNPTNKSHKMENVKVAHNSLDLTNMLNVFLKLVRLTNTL